MAKRRKSAALPAVDLMEMAELARLLKTKRGTEPRDDRFSAAISSEYRRLLRGSEKAFGVVCEVWAGLTPVMLREHCAPIRMTRGDLVVHVDNSANLYELKNVLQQGLEAQLRHACAAQGLRSVHLRVGALEAEQSIDPRRLPPADAGGN